MPAEQNPFNRKEFVYRGRRLHERDPSGGGSLSSSPTPWRWDPNHSPSPRRHFSGHCKQVFADEPGFNGHNITRSKVEGCRNSYGRYNRTGNSRETHDYFRRSSWNYDDLPRQQHDSVTTSAQRLVAIPSGTPASPSPSSSSSYQPQLPSFKHHREKNDLVISSDAFNRSTGDDMNQNHTLGPVGWKKWSRSGSFSSSTKHIRSDSDGAMLDGSALPGKETTVQTMVSSPSLPDETKAMKKPRLGWGQGLAKYEKQKVGGPEDSCGRDDIANGGSGATVTHSDSSPKTGPVGSTSPATPTSITCNSSRGALEEKLEFSIAKIDDVAIHEPQASPVVFSMKLEHLNIDSITSLNSLLTELLQPEEACSGDTNNTILTVSNKLLMLKCDILKELLKTEGEIDSSESELKNFSHVSQLQTDDFIGTSCNNLPCPTQGDSISTSTPAALDLQQDVSLNTFKFRTKELHSENAVSVMLKSCNSDVPVQVSTNYSLVSMDENLVNVDPIGSEKLGNHLDLPSDPCEIDQNPAALSVRYDHQDKVTICADSEKSLPAEVDCSQVVAKIMASNRISSGKASEILSNHLPFRLPLHESKSAVKDVDLKIREKLAIRKSFLKFKERALTLKYRAFHLLWKEDLRLLSMMKRRSKSQKRCELRCRSSQNGSENLRSSPRLQIPMPGKTTLMPTKEIVGFTRGFSSDSKIKIHRNFLKMPALILDDTDKRHSRFATVNGLIDDPFLIEKEKALINPWTNEEKMVFLELLGTYGKDFRKVSSFLHHKTTADCVGFYYKNHKSESFEHVRKMLKLKKQGQSLPSNNYMVAPGKQWKEDGVASLDILGMASEIISNSNDNKIRQKFTSKSVSGGVRDMPISRRPYSRSSSAEFHADAAAAAAADVLTGIGNSISSEGMGSCITTSVDIGEKMDFLQVDHPFFSEVVSHTIDEEDSSSDEGFGELDSVDWTDEEKSMFVNAYRLYGMDFIQISHCVGTRSKEQCKIFFSKTRKSLGLDMAMPSIDTAMASSDVNEGRSDTDDAFVAEMDSAICSNHSSSKVDDFTQSVLKKSNQEFRRAANACNQIDCNEWFIVGQSNNEEVDTKIACLTSSSINHDGKMTVVDQADKLKSENFYGLVDGEMQKHNNVLTSQLPSATAEVIVKVEQNPLCEPQLASSGDSDSGLNCKSQPLGFLESALPCNKGRNGMSCTTARKNTPHLLQPDSDAIENTSEKESSVSFFPQVSYTPNHLNSQFLSWKQKENCSTLFVKPPHMQYTYFDDKFHAAKHSSLGHEEHNIKQNQCTLDRDGYQQRLIRNQILPQANQPLQILKGCPLPLSNKSGLNADAVHFDHKSASLRGLSKKNENLDHLHPITADIYGEKCNMFNDLDRVHSVVPKSTDSSNNQLRPCSQGTVSETEEPSLRCGDFKLFGKILSHPSHLTKSEETENKSASPKLIRSGLNSNLKTDRALIPSQTETSSNTSGGDLPLRTYGFWDGKRIQTGFTSLPESAIVLSEYPGGLPGVTSYYPTKENADSNGLVTLQRSFLADGKQHSIFSDLRKRSGVETLPGFQQQQGGGVALNMVGGGSSLVGVSCTGVSDPVAAIKMHYANQSVLLGKEDESRRGGGDAGGRL